MADDASTTDWDLKTELEETRRVRDEWCAEYVRVRDELALYRMRYDGLCGVDGNLFED